jgi:hypothetical protein
VETVSSLSLQQLKYAEVTDMLRNNILVLHYPGMILFTFSAAEKKKCSMMSIMLRQKNNLLGSWKGLNKSNVV